MLSSFQKEGLSMTSRISQFAAATKVAVWVAFAFSIALSTVYGQKRGSLLVLADSGATVYLNGQYQGLVVSAQDGLEITGLKPGIHGVVLRRMGAESEEHRVEVKAGRQAILDKRGFRTMPVEEVRTPSSSPISSPAVRDTAGGVFGANRFIGLWREQRNGTYGNAHFEITVQQGTFYVRRFGEGYPSDALKATNMVDRTGGRSFGVVRLEGGVRHYGGTIGMSLVIHAVVRDPMKDLNSDTLAVQYMDVVGGGAKFEGEPRGYWVRMKR
jgi:hypothetical protein